MKKFLFILIGILLLSAVTACSKHTNSSASSTIKVGIIDNPEIWDYVKQKAEKQGLHLQIVMLSGGADPNTALEDGDIDVNAFQHIAYLDEWNKAHKINDIVPIGATIISPGAIFSKKYKSLNDLPNNAKIAVPNSPSNFGRALILLQHEGLITLKDNFNGLGGKNAIKTNPKHLQFVEGDVATLPRVLADVDAAFINNEYAIKGGLDPIHGSLAVESNTATPYVNLIAAKKDRENDANLKKLVKIYQTKDVANFIKKTYKGSSVAAFISLDELKDYKKTYANLK